MSLVALADVEAWLGLASGNSDEALLTRLIAGASAFVETWCSRTFALTSYTETRDGNGQTRMSPQNWPISTVASVTIDTTVVPARTVPGGSGFFLNGKSIQLVGYCFNRGQANVTLVYSAGFATIPADIQQGVIELVAMRYKERDRIGLSSVSAAGETTSYITKDMPNSVATLLGQWRQVVPR
jgi:hypothetical protein